MSWENVELVRPTSSPTTAKTSSPRSERTSSASAPRPSQRPCWPCGPRTQAGDTSIRNASGRWPAAVPWTRRWLDRPGSLVGGRSGLKFRESYVYRVVEYRDLGEWVLALVDVRARGRGGIPVETRTFEIRGFREGQVAVCRVFSSEPDALKAAGLLE